MGKFDLVSSLHALPETDAIEIEGIQFGDYNCGGGNNTCQSACVALVGIIWTVSVQTICIVGLTVC